MSDLISCSGCSTVWTAAGAAHCSGPGCHRTFSSVGLFDKHRSQYGEHGRCLDPETITHARTGERLMFFRAGMWRGPAMDEETKAKRFGMSESSSVLRTV